MVSLLFCFREGFEPTSMRGSGGALPLGGWTPSALYDLPLKGQIGNRIPHPLLWTPHGVSSFLLQRGIRPHPMQGSGGALPIGSSMPIAPYDLPQRQIGHRIPHPLPRGCSNSSIFLALAAGPPNKPDFNRVEFDPVKNGAGSDALFMLPQNAFIQSTENALRCRLGTGGHSFNQKLRGCYKGFFPVTASKWYFTMPRSSPKSLCPSPG